MKLNNLFLKIGFFSLLFFHLICLATPQIDLKQAKDRQFVGETLSGYIELVDIDNKNYLEKVAEIEKFIETINYKRKQSYQKIADDNNLSVEIVANIAGQKLVKNVQPGHYAKGINGQWKLF